MSAFNVISLSDGRVVDLDTHLAGGWGPIRIADLAAGDSLELPSIGSETCAFVIEGEGHVTLDGTRRDVDAGTGIAVIEGSTAWITASADMRLFTASLPVRR